MRALGQQILAFLKRPPSYRDDQLVKTYIRSYRWIRVTVGVLGLALPIFLLLGETSLLRGGVPLQGSLSAYYHTSMQDLFVGDLSVVGVLLITYMSGDKGNPDFWVSLLAGIAVLGVVAFPTSLQGGGQCPSPPTPYGCSPVEQALGEQTTADIHAWFARTFIVTLAIMSFLFAREVVHSSRRSDGFPEHVFRENVFFVACHRLCGVIILVAGIWALAGAHLGSVTPLYLGEVVSISAFGASWLLATFNVKRPVPSASPAGGRPDDGGSASVRAHPVPGRLTQRLGATSASAPDQPAPEP